MTLQAKISENATNGDVIAKIYPHADIQIFESLNTVNVATDKKLHAQTFDLDWWNAPYQGAVAFLRYAGSELDADIYHCGKCGESIRVKTADELNMMEECPHCHAKIGQIKRI